MSSAGELDDKELGDCVQASSSTDLCLPALSYLHGCSQVGERAGRPRWEAPPPPTLAVGTEASSDCLCNGGAFEPQLLANIYLMPSKPAFVVSRPTSLPAGPPQQRSPSTEDAVHCILQEFDDGTGEFCLAAAAVCMSRRAELRPVPQAWSRSGSCCWSSWRRPCLRVPGSTSLPRWSSSSRCSGRSRPFQVRHGDVLSR